MNTVGLAPLTRTIAVEAGGRSCQTTTDHEVGYDSYRRVPDGDFLQSSWSYRGKAEGQTSTTCFLKRKPDIVEITSPSNSMTLGEMDGTSGPKDSERQRGRASGRPRALAGPCVYIKICGWHCTNQIKLTCPHFDRDDLPKRGRVL